MKSEIIYYPVGNGDMTLITLADNKTILTDCKINEDEDATNNCDVRKELRRNLQRNKDGRLFVDVFVLSHPDEDHCKGLQDNFHLGSTDGYSDKDDKIIINEMWSSPMVFRRKKKDETICDDAAEWKKEAKRRVKYFRDTGQRDAGNQILILGEDDENDNTDIAEIVVEPGTAFNSLNNQTSAVAEMYLLGPLSPGTLDEDSLSKNDSSIIIQYRLASSLSNKDACRLLMGGDAGVEIWRYLWSTYQNDIDKLNYDILLSPHHCSWTPLSLEPYDNGNGKIDLEARNALSQTIGRAIIISSSKPIEKNDNDPPCYGAKKEYKDIVEKVKGNFYCTGEEPNKISPKPIKIKITVDGPVLVENTQVVSVGSSGSGSLSTVARHG